MSDVELFGQDSDEEKVQKMEEDLFGDSDNEVADKIETTVETTVETQLPWPENPLPENPNLFLVKLPNFLTIDPKPFDPREVEEEDEMSPTIATKVENKVRWRYDPAKKGKKDSNARLVRWSDGSFSLMVGDELFEVSQTNIADNQNYLISQHPKEGFFKTQARLNTLMSFRPSSITSLTHKKLTMAIASKHAHANAKVAKIIATKEDPEKQQAEAARIENERLKAKRKLEMKQRQSRERSFYDSDVYERGNKSMMNDLERFEEYEDDDFAVDDDLEQEMDREQESRLMAAKRSEPVEEKPKLKRLRIEDSDEDE
ncbi:Leo1-like protein-domain-containing protein [Gorgonomyces haynaldii]|nr:Leo1-like protein-domain-containing protein [Gorgonomyces haynaldii]